MNPYTLALSLALGEARAEEPKECIDSINLTVEIKPSVKTEGIEATIDSALQKVQDFYQREVQLPVMWKYQTPREPNDIHVIYGNVDDCMKEWFPNVEAVEAYWKTVITTGKEHEDVQNFFAQREELPLFIKKEYDKMIIEHMRDSIKDSWATTHPSEKEIYVFRNSVEMRHAAIVAHELGHILGLKHTPNDAAPEPLNIRYVPLSEEPLKRYHVSAEDKLKIQSQICKPEETK